MENLQEQIAKRAFELFEARGGVDGYHIQDWLQAEKEVVGAAPAPKKKSAVKDESATPVPVKVKKSAVPKEKAEKAAPAKKAAVKK